MKRLLLVLVTASGAALMSACGGGEVVVLVEAERSPTASEASAIPNLMVRLLPYDRDMVFDSLQAAFPEPEPEIPATLVDLQNELAEANAEWQEATSRWNNLRARLREISEEMEAMGPQGRTTVEYEMLFRDFADLEPQVDRAQRDMDRAFERFNTLQNEYVTQADETRVRREMWEDRAFADVDQVILAKLEEVGLMEMADTTTSSGVVRFRPKSGTWWVVARYELPYHEYYWNVPVDVQRGEPIQVRLSRENALIRPKF